MNSVQSRKTVGLQIVHAEECGDGSCGCGCGEITTVTAEVPEAAARSQDCCGPVCGPESCG